LTLGLANHRPFIFIRRLCVRFYAVVTKVFVQ